MIKTSINRLPSYPDYPVWWRKYGPALVAAYTAGETSFIYGLLPERALQFSGVQLAEVLYNRLGKEVFLRAIDPEQTTPSPAENARYLHNGAVNGEWLKRSRTVGINVRTIGSFYNILKYALTLPAHVNCIHLLPIWEAGVVASLYGMASWRINPEFFSHEMVIQYPQLNTVEKQLKVVVNLLHALGKMVGMDVIPHTDRYSEMVLANPHYFEWLQRDDLRIVDHRDDLSVTVAERIFDWLVMNGPAIPYVKTTDGKVQPQRLPFNHRDLEQLPEAERLLLLFGQPADLDTRRERRIRLVDYLFYLGYEPVPATMAPPYRGLEVDPDPAALTVDDAGRTWRDYRITQPQEMSRVFGPLTRYKLYGRKDHNANWQIDFEQPRPQVWVYVAEHYEAVQREYNFDFMRGDMSHVQMRPTGTPAQPDAYYDLLGYVKQHIQQTVPYFAYFAESFLAPDNYMAYGNEADHLEASHAEVTLGNLQSMVPGSEEFIKEFSHYLNISEERSVVPAFTIITGDKDDPRFDEFYQRGNLARLFTGLFLSSLPSYFSLGFEQRDIHLVPAPNEHYTKLYVFHLDEGPKATRGPYRWGQNMSQFREIDRLHRFAENLLPQLSGAVSWLVRPDTTAKHAVVAWQVGGIIFVVNFGKTLVSSVQLPLAESENWEVIYSTHQTDVKRAAFGKENVLVVDYLAGDEGLVLRKK